MNISKRKRGKIIIIMEEKYVIENDCTDYIQIVLLTEEQAKAINWVFDAFDLDNMTICKVDEYTAISIND